MRISTIELQGKRRMKLIVRMKGHEVLFSRLGDPQVARIVSDADRHVAAERILKAMQERVTSNAIDGLCIVLGMIRHMVTNKEGNLRS